MKRLIFISGTMGIGKTTISKLLLKELKNSVFLDGDWCWNINPFVVNDENKIMVENNICFLLNSFIRNSNIENIIFCWVMNKQEIIDTLIDKINGYDKFYHFSLMITPELLKTHFYDDIKKGERETYNVEKAIEYLPGYDLIKSIKIEVKEGNIIGIINEIKKHLDESNTNISDKASENQQNRTGEYQAIKNITAQIKENIEKRAIGSKVSKKSLDYDDAVEEIILKHNIPEILKIFFKFENALSSISMFYQVYIPVFELLNWDNGQVMIGLYNEENIREEKEPYRLDLEHEQYTKFEAFVLDCVDYELLDINEENLVDLEYLLSVMNNRYNYIIPYKK